MGHENEFGAVYRDVMAWCNETFGYDRDEMGLAEHLRLETEELWEAIEKWKKGWRPKDEIFGEIADVVILIINLSGRLGVNPEMLMRAVRSKLEINREREWIKYPDGTYRHRKGGE